MNPVESILTQLQQAGITTMSITTTSVTLLPPDKVDQLMSYIDYSALQFRDNVQSDSETVCSICMCNVGRYSAQLQCGHQFHYSCVANWLRMGGGKCPLCRRDHTCTHAFVADKDKV